MTHNRKTTPRKKVRRRRGLTLVELVVGMAVTSTIVFAAGASILIAQRALPDAEGPAQAMISDGRVAGDLAAELQYATSIVAQSANAIEFTVADRDGDEVAETISYAWSGTPGDPLTRQYNGGSIVTILEGVEDFELACTFEVVSEEVTPENESAETLLIDYSSTQSLTDYATTDSSWHGQYFLPSLPAETISWKVTQVEFLAKKSGASTGESKVQIQLADGALRPSGAILEEKTLLEGTLTSSYLTQQFAFSSVSGLSPDQGLCLVVEWVANGTACLVQGQGSGVATPNSHLVSSTDQGSSWSALTDQSLLFSVYGTVTTAGEPQIQDVNRLQAVEITLRTRSDESSTVHTAARTLNRPRIL
jgi:hypothetical protein